MVLGAIGKAGVFVGDLLESISQIGNGRVAKERQPRGLFSGGRLAALLLSHRALWLCSFVAPCQPPARKTALPFLICEMGSAISAFVRCEKVFDKMAGYVR